ncbi:Keratin, type II cytoskeletal 72 [Manis javanica]|nr:Keratin, type II cytoskeletal 72 [Manis javanica]
MRSCGLLGILHKSVTNPAFTFSRVAAEKQIIVIREHITSPNTPKLCPPQGVVQLNVILNICQLNQSSKFSPREHDVDL